MSRVRTDISAVKHPDGGSRWTDQPLNVNTLEAHFNGGPARGACPIKAGESVTMIAVLDMDSHKGATPWDDMMRVACELESGLELFGLYAIPFRSSGGRGIHLMFMWDEPQDAYSVRQALINGIGMCGYASGAKGIADKQIEVFPKQNEVGTGPKDRGSQFILPLAGLSAPINLTFGMVLDREAITDVEWKMSDPVTVLDQPDRAAQALPDAVESTDRVREALFTIRNDGSNGSPDYDRWFPIVCAVHEALGGTDDAKALVIEWSELNPVFDQPFFEERVWPYVKPADKRDSAVTRGTLFAEASKAGWNSATPEGFADVIFEHTPAAASTSGFGAPLTSPTAGVDGRDLPGFKRKNDGSIPSIIPNLLMACRDPLCAGWHIAHDQFSDEVMLSVDGDQWRGFADADYTRLRDHLERNGFDPIAKENMRDVVHLVAQENQFDSAQRWLNSQKWDGVERVPHFLHRYAGAAASAYATAVSAYWWTAHAGRVLEPGCQADMAPILVGPQGSGKTSLVNAIAPAPEFAVELTFDDHDDDQARKLRRKLVAELGELQGLRKRAHEQVKAFITRRCENWIPKFKEFGTSYLRRAVFAGTTNQDQFLVDDTGNRRWLPVVVTKCDPAAVERDRDQLWAEAAVMFKEGGIRWQDAERLAQLEHSKFKVPDVWEERFASWLQHLDIDGTPIAQRPHITMSMALVECMGIDASRATRGDQMRAAAALKSLGYESTHKWVDGKTQRVYALA